MLHSWLIANTLHILTNDLSAKNSFANKKKQKKTEFKINSINIDQQI